MNDNFKTKNHELNALFNFKIEDNIPKFLLSYKNIFISVYENNQITLINYKINMKETKNYEKEKIKKIEINKNRNTKLIPKVSGYSNIYSDKYHPDYLFSNELNYYYCSSDNLEAYFELDFSQEYYFTEFKILFSKTYYDCRPKTYKVQAFDYKKRLINEFLFSNKENDKLEKINVLNNQARYLKFIFTENFGGDYYVIKKIEFSNYFLDNIE